MQHFDRFAYVKTMPKTILLVDDNAIVRKTIRKRFEEEGFICAEAEDGLDAIQQVRSFNPNVVVLDLSMPRMNGLQAAPKLREILPSALIILFTLFAGAIAEPDARQAGISMIVSKDQSVVSLVNQVKALTETSSS